MSENTCRNIPLIPVFSLQSARCVFEGNAVKAAENRVSVEEVVQVAT